MTEDEMVQQTLDGQGTVETTDSHGRGVYANEEYAQDRGLTLRTVAGDASDEVDPRKLVRDPTLSEIRWYYRRTFAKVLVDKPIDDAFKNGFTIESDNAEEARTILERPRWDGDGEGWLGAYRLAEKKARRDGFALIFIGTREAGSEGIHVSPISQEIDVDRVTHLSVLTIDDLASVAPHEQIKEGTDLDETQYDVRQTGIVINTDPQSPDFRTPIGYVLQGKQPRFIHADRVQHLTWNREVDGDYKGEGVRRWDARRTTLGEWEGDSVLIPSYNLMKGISKGNWAVMQTLFRNAAHMYSVTLPEDADEEDMDMAFDATKNINAKSALLFPHGYEVEQHASGNELEPDNHYGVLFDQICAAHEMTKSVLFGTQAGTVSGSDVDIKNYFNQVERYRTNRAEGKMKEYLTRAKRMTDSRTSPEFEYEIEIEWGPLFKVDEETRIQMLQNASQAIGNLIGNYALTPDEAREVLSEEFVEIDLGSLTEEQMDVLDRINLTNMGQGPAAMASEEEYTEGPETGQSSSAGQQGGRSGSKQGASQSSTTGVDDLTGALADDEEFKEMVAEKVAEKMTEG